MCTDVLSNLCSLEARSHVFTAEQSEAALVQDNAEPSPHLKVADVQREEQSVVRRSGGDRRIVDTWGDTHA